MRSKTANEGKYLIFTALIGATCSIVMWLFLLAIDKGTELIWEVVPSLTGNWKWYPLAACIIGGLIIGIFRKINGDYPQDMMTVLGTVKKTKTYKYDKMLMLIVAALLPLIFGFSIGPEAGMVGIITGLCCWAGDNLKFAKKESALYSQLGASVSLSLLFHAPLFGLFHMEEGEDSRAEQEVISKKAIRVAYVVAAAVGIGIFKLLNNMVCDVSMGFPSFEVAKPEGFDYIAMFIYIIAGLILGAFFAGSEKVFEAFAKKIPAIAREVFAGAVLGLIVVFIPVVQFSGEHQMGVLIEEYAMYPALGLIGVGFLKVLMTNMCIHMGLKGGHFFPLIFSAVCVGYGIALIIWPGMASHAVFAAAITTAATLGYSMKKPLAVTMLLFICFPIEMAFWILFAAALASFISGWRPGRKNRKAV